MGTASSAGRLRRGWEYYRQYTKRRTGVHAAATAALTGFGLLAYFEQWFVAVAIAAYLVPPIYLYLAGDDLADRDPSANEHTSRRETTETSDTDRDSDGTDADFDGNDADADGADADADGADADFDG